jgi:hypothetical protein
MKDILEHIERVRAYMLKEHIKANTIIIDSEIAKVNGFQYLSTPETITDVPIMFMGLQVFYEKKLSEKVGTPVNFVMAERKIETPKNPLSEYSTDELLDEIRKRIE